MKKIKTPLQMESEPKEAKANGKWGAKIYTLLVVCGSAYLLYWIFGGGGKQYTGSIATIAKVIIIVVMAGLILCGILLLLKGDKRKIHGLASKFNRRMAGVGTAVLA